MQNQLLSSIVQPRESNGSQLEEFTVEDEDVIMSSCESMVKGEENLEEYFTNEVKAQRNYK